MSYPCQYCERPFTTSWSRKRHERHYCWTRKLQTKQLSPIPNQNDNTRQALEKIHKAFQNVLIDLSEPRPDVASS